MNKKLFYVALFSLFAFSVIGFIGINKAIAQTASFPNGCSSALGYSVTTALPCNGTSVATNMFMPGCDSALGYSTTDGRPCSGGSVAISWLAGCSSVIGYSDITGLPCNGTFVATTTIPTPTIPGLPRTGFGGNVLINIIVLLSAGLVGALSFVYAKNKTSREEK